MFGAQSAQSAHRPQEIYTIEELLDAFKMQRMSKAAGPGRRAYAKETGRFGTDVIRELANLLSRF